MVSSASSYVEKALDLKLHKLNLQPNFHTLGIYISLGKQPPKLNPLHNMYVSSIFKDTKIN